MKNAPYSWTIKELLDHARTGPRQSSEPARPFGLYSLSSRWILARDVFTGKADALYWPNQKPPAAH